jgi:molybdate/tungstate transport system substrate-binding protein
MKIFSRAILVSLLGWTLAACAAQTPISPARVGGTQTPASTSAFEKSKTSAIPAGPLTPQPSPTLIPAQRTPLVVFCAGSLILPFDELEQAFETQHPEIDVLNECHGSIQVIRHVTELHESIDVVATADHALIPMLMYTATDPDSGLPYASWYVRFAGNRLALAYSKQSQGASEVNAQNWYEWIIQPGVNLGLADPRFDAAGYRALMALKLAEDFYNDPQIFESVIKDSFLYPITVFTEDGLSEISVPEVVEPLPGSGVVIRGASIQLIALLESGDLDYAFEYESVIRQHGLSWVTLPDEINLGAAEHADDYANFQVKLDFQRFASVKPVFRGEPIGYGITIPSNAPHPQAAETYIAFLLSPAGRAVMAQNYQPMLDPPVCDNPAQMPTSLKSLCGEPGP